MRGTAASGHAGLTQPPAQIRRPDVPPLRCPSGFLITHQIVSQTLAGSFSIDRRRVEQRRSQAVAALSRAAAAFPNVRLIDPLDVFCDSDNCSRFGPTGFFYLDTDHLSALGAELLYRHFERDFFWVFEGGK